MLRKKKISIFRNIKVYAFCFLTRNNICEVLIRDDEDSLEESSSDEEICSVEEDEAMKFQVVLPPEEWQKYYTGETVSYRGVDQFSMEKMYHTLVAGGSSAMNRHILQNLNIRCTLSFKRAKIYKMGTIFLKIEDHCTVCRSSLEGELLTAFEGFSHFLF